jgi:hypothetical protein
MNGVIYEECLASSREENGDAAVRVLNEDCYYVEKRREDGQLRGVDFFHREPNGEACGGYVNILGEGSPKWTVQQREPLTLSPSVWCKGPVCGGFHGFIRNGCWEGC